MAPKPQALLFLLLPLLLSSSVMAYNVTQILESFSDFATFNNYLTRTKLADEINRRQTITVLVVDNTKMSALSSLDVETLKRVMAVHVILDYYDENKLANIFNKSALLTTLFQTTGIANDSLGFLNVTSRPNEVMLFGSAIPKAPLSSTFSKVIMTIPYNISILQISDPIVPPGIEGAKQTSSSSSSSSSKAPPVAKPAKSTTNAPAPNNIGKPMTDAPVEAPNAVDSPADALKANASQPLTKKPASDAPVASPNSPRKVASMSASSSSASRMMVDSLIVGLVIGVVLLLAF